MGCRRRARAGNWIAHWVAVLVAAREGRVVENGLGLERSET